MGASKAKQRKEKKRKKKPHFSKRERATPPKERARVGQQRLNLAGDGPDHVSEEVVALSVGFGRQRPHLQALDLGEPRVDEEGDAGAGQRALGVVGRGREQVVGGVRVGQEGGDDGRLGEDGAVVRERWDEAARVDLQVCWRARGVEVDDFFFEGLRGGGGCVQVREICRACFMSSTPG